MLHAIIMAGGSGTRFWPASRHATPKQMLALAGPRTMIQSTADRLTQCVAAQRTYVITAEHLVGPIAQQLPELPAEHIVGEPCRRDTAPCVGLAAAMVAAVDPDGVMVVCPADHVITDHVKFASAIRDAEAILQSRPGAIVTFGIRPSYAAESFGYIERGGEIAGAGDGETGAYEVVQFREKPDRQTAEQYLAAGTFYWNSGIFVWRASTILDALKKHEPAMHGHLMTIASRLGAESFTSTLAREFEQIEGKSIDYAVMERHEDVVVIEAPFDWDDVGSWQALSRLNENDEHGNVAIGEHLGIDTKGCIIQSPPGHMVVTIDCEDLIVVQAGNATLVAPKASEERVREAVAALKASGREGLV